MARLLIFDTSGGACSAAVWSDGSVIAERYAAMPRGQAERLLPMIEEALTAAGLAHRRLDALGVTRGPGAFTGIRIGLAAARGLALALGIPAIGVTTFEALAVRAPGGCAVAIDTKRNDVYFQLFGPGGASDGEPGILTPAGAIAAAGENDVPLVSDTPAPDGSDTRRDAGRHPHGSLAGPPRAAEFAPLIAARYEALGPYGVGDGSGDGSGCTGMPRPLYLRPPEARIPEAGRRMQRR